MGFIECGHVKVCIQYGKSVNLINIALIGVISQHRVLCGALTYGPRDIDLSKAQAFIIS
jgi:hypothetical protein